jgi:hypothetical protein
MIQVKYILKQNRNTDYYNAGKLWFGTHKITWSKWLFGKRFRLGYSAKKRVDMVNFNE